MPKRLRLLLDECVSSPKSLWATRTVLEGLDAQDSVHLDFLQNFMKRRGTKDKVWVPAAAEAGFSLVITADQGRKKRGDKLPALCEKYRLTHVLVTHPVMARGLSFITFALLGAWSKVLAASNDPCLRFKLQLVPLQGKNEVGDHRVGLFRAPAPSARRA